MERTTPPSSFRAIDNRQPVRRSRLLPLPRLSDFVCACITPPTSSASYVTFAWASCVSVVVIKKPLLCCANSNSLHSRDQRHCLHRGASLQPNWFLRCASGCSSKDAIVLRSTEIHAAFAIELPTISPAPDAETTTSRHDGRRVSRLHSLRASSLVQTPEQHSHAFPVVLLEPTTSQC